MNIIFFTQEDPFYVKLFFDEFFLRCQRLDEIKAVVISHPMGKKSMVQLARQMYNFYGLVNFIQMGFRFGFSKVMSKRNLKETTSIRPAKTYSVKQAADARGVKVLERSDLNSGVFHALIREYDADLFISIASPIIFKEALINIPARDCINIHNAPLPKYRGMLPNFWQLYHGETSVGMTVHRIEKGIDTGDIIKQHYMPVPQGATLDMLIKKTKRENARLIIETIEDFRSGNVQYRKMEGEGSYFTFPGREDVKAFKRRGKKIM